MFKLKYKTEPGVIVTVCGKEYIPRYRLPFIACVMPISIHTLISLFYHEAEYNVFVMYEGKEYCINDRDLYVKVNINHTISVCVHRGYDRKGREKNVYITKD